MAEEKLKQFENIDKLDEKHFAELFTTFYTLCNDMEINELVALPPVRQVYKKCQRLIDQKVFDEKEQPNEDYLKGLQEDLDRDKINETLKQHNPESKEFQEEEEEKE